MQKLWGVFWIRILVSLIVAPVLVMTTFVLTGDGIQIVTELKDGTPVLSDLLPPLHLFPIFLGAGEVLIWPPLIGVELNGRRHDQPLAAGFYAVFTVVFSAIFIGLVYILVTAYERLSFLNDLNGLVNGFTRIGLFVGIYIGSILLSMVAISPYAQRWRTRQLSEARVDQVF